MPVSIDFKLIKLEVNYLIKNSRKETYTLENKSLTVVEELGLRSTDNESLKLQTLQCLCAGWHNFLLYMLQIPGCFISKAVGNNSISCQLTIYKCAIHDKVIGRSRCPAFSSH